MKLKRFHFLLLAVVLFSFTTLPPTKAIAQPQFGPEISGVHSDVHYAVENVQFNSITTVSITITPTSTKTIKNGVTTYKEDIAVKWGSPKVQSNTGGYGLNWFQDETNERGVKYQGLSDSGYVFYREPKQMPIGYFGWERGRLYQSGTTWIYERVAEMPDTFTYYRNQKLQKVHKSVILSKLRITEDQYVNKAKFTLMGVEVNPNTHITSVFPYFTYNTNTGVATNYTFVNGKHWETVNYASLKTFYGKTGLSFVWRWVLYNGCNPSDVPKVQAHPYYGNFGQCLWFQYEKNDPKAKTITVTAGQKGYSGTNHTIFYSSTETYAVLTLELEELPAQGKNFRPVGHYTINGCDEDDPCGWAYRMPRTPYIP